MYGSPYRNNHQTTEYAGDVFLLKRNGWILVGAWTLIMLISLIWNWHQQEEKIYALALNNLKRSFEKDLLYRRWAADHGGVYVPVSEKTPPNPHLSDISERDIITASGEVLTLVNPAYMTRQVHELGRKNYGIQGNITSLNPLRPENIPDQWEKQALMSFNKGEKEAVAVMELDGEAYMRFMKPVVTEKGCLKCHAHQGYRVGDIRGGISESVPLSSYFAHVKSQQYAFMAGHGVIWLVGLFFIKLMTSRIIAVRMAGEKERMKAEKAINDQLRFEKMVSDISARFVKLSSKRVEDGINHALKLTGEFFEFDRAYIIDFTGDSDSMPITHEWCAEGIKPQTGGMANYSMGSFPWLAEKVKTREYIYMPDTDDLPPEAGAEKKAFRSRNIRSFLCMPLIAEGRLFGLLSFDAVRENKAWAEDYGVLLSVVGELISNSLARAMTDEKIRHLSFHDQLTGLYNRSYLDEECAGWTRKGNCQ